MASVSEELIGASIFLPGEISVEILSKVTDLRTLCSCKCVSRRFYQIASQVACQVDTISLIAPASWNTDNSEFCEDVNSFAVLKKRHGDKNFYGTQTGRRFIYLDGGLIDSMTKFTRLKSLYIELPALSSFKDLPFLKWKVFTADNRIKSIVVLSPISIHGTKGSSYDDHEKERTSTYVWHCDPAIASTYVEDVFVRYMMLLGFAHECPYLEKISITDSCQRGRISLSGAKLSEARESSTIPLKVDEFHHATSWCRIPVLDLPVAGLVMKGVELIVFQDVHLPSGYTYDRSINIEGDFEDREEAAYSEAVREIFKKYRDKIRRWYWPGKLVSQQGF